MKKLLVVFLASFAILSCGQSVQRQEVTFNENWHFSLGEQPEAVVQSDFDDAGWESVRLPHDWAIAGPFDSTAIGRTGKLPWRGMGWYRKSFTIDKKHTGQRVYFDFDGVMAFPKVYVNGELAGEWDYGYMSFRVDATPDIRFRQENIIAVQADTREHRSRWYPGAGIYRKVTMSIVNPVHLAHWGTFITTPEVTDAQASILVSSEIENHLESATDAQVRITLSGPDGNQVGQETLPVSIPATGSGAVEHLFRIDSPQRWNIQNPNLYAAKVEVMDGNTVLDEQAYTFGIRTFRFTADDGFYLNGRRVQLYGVNLHHDHGPLGAAFYTRAMERQLEIMREMGVNAIRTSHNPPAPELLDLCDRMGFVVWDEAFDKWEGTADRVHGELLEEFGERQIRNFVRRDRNHPSVVVWSIGNEIGNQPYSEEGKSPERVRFMTEFVSRYDPTRPVGLGCHIQSTVEEPILDALDLTGWNYNRRYFPFRDVCPDKPIVYAESASAFSTRGYYELPLPESRIDYSNTLQITSYDHTSARWSDIPELEFYRMEVDTFVAGEFVWTGFDYLGEPTPFTQEARSSYFGIVDLVGIPKDRYFLYRTYWRPDVSTAHILPHWNWPDREGDQVPVYVYTNGDSAELFLNGISLGSREKQMDIRPEVTSIREEDNYYRLLDRYRLRWLDVTYEPGELKAVAYRDGKVIGDAAVRTAGPLARIKLTPDRTQLSATGEDLSYILVEALDSDGDLSPLADNMVRFSVEGPAEIAGVGNGNPLSLEPFQADYRRLFYGNAMLILQTLDGVSGQVRVTATGDGLEQGEVVLTVENNTE